MALEQRLFRQLSHRQVVQLYIQPFAAEQQLCLSQFRMSQELKQVQLMALEPQQFHQLSHRQAVQLYIQQIVAERRLYPSQFQTQAE